MGGKVFSLPRAVRDRWMSVMSVKVSLYSCAEHIWWEGEREKASHPVCYPQQQERGVVKVSLCGTQWQGKRLNQWSVSVGVQGLRGGGVRPGR